MLENFGYHGVIADRNTKAKYGKKISDLYI